MHIVMICKAEAAVLLTVTQDHADQIKAAVAAAQPQLPDDEPEDSDGSSRIDAVRAYFEEHHRKKSVASASAEEHVDVQPGTLILNYSCVEECKVYYSKTGFPDPSLIKDVY